MFTVDQNRRLGRRRLRFERIVTVVTVTSVLVGVGGALQWSTWESHERTKRLSTTKKSVPCHYEYSSESPCRGATKRRISAGLSLSPSLRRGSHLGEMIRGEEPSVTNSDATTSSFDHFTVRKKLHDEQDGVEGVSESNLHLLSLKWCEATTDSSSPSTPTKFSKVTATIWRWKDAVLGDGRDFFVPKPKTLSALQRTLLDLSSPKHCPTKSDNAEISTSWEGRLFEECVVLSNCARFEILLKTSSADVDKDVILPCISQALIYQEQFYQQKKKKERFSLSALFAGVADQPDWICNIDNLVASPMYSDDIDELCQYITYTNSTHDIALHLGRIAAGMEARPRRPNRKVLFRPFSSRDAHILLQLKRLLDTTMSRNDGSKILKTLLQAAIRIGKGVRNSDKVPELLELRKYGAGGDNNAKYAVEPPESITEMAKEAAIRRVIEPVVEETLQQLRAKQQANVIADFRERAFALAKPASNNGGKQSGDEELAWIRKQIHEPTMILRGSNQRLNRTSPIGIKNALKTVDVDQILEDLSRQLEERRRSRILGKDD